MRDTVGRAGSCSGLATACSLSQLQGLQRGEAGWGGGPDCVPSPLGLPGHSQGPADAASGGVFWGLSC